MIPEGTNHTHTNRCPECVRVWPGDRGGEGVAITRTLVESCPITAERKLSDGQTVQWEARRRSRGGGLRVPLVCGRRAGDSCPEWRRRSRSRGRGQRLIEGPRRCPQLLTGEGAERGLGVPGAGRRQDRSRYGGLGHRRPIVSSALGVRGLGARGLPGAGCLRRGSGWVGSDWVATGGGVSEQASQPAGVTSPTPSPARTPFLPLPAAPFVPARPGSAPPLPAHLRGRRLPVSDFIE